jgi:CheY-like chemotaxis protein
MQILLWDQQSVERELIEEMLVTIGCDVTAVRDKQDCQSKLKDNKYDLVIFDQGLPDLDVREFVAELARIDPLIPITMMGTLNMEFYEEKYVDSEIDFIISKPFDLAQLRKLVSEASEFRQRLKETTSS